MKTFHDWLLWLLGSTLLSEPYQTASARPGPPALIHGKTFTASPVEVMPSLTRTGVLQLLHPGVAPRDEIVHRERYLSLLGRFLHASGVLLPHSSER